MSNALAEIKSPAQHLEAVAIDVSQIAAGLVAQSVGKAAAARTKSSPTDVVTHTDFESEVLIRRELLERCPGSTVIGEEFDDEVGSNGVGWIVDPIDGTVNFLYDLPVVSVSVAATLQGKVVAGAVTDILRRETFSAATNSGARLNGQQITTSVATNHDEALVGTGFAYSASVRSEQAQALTRILPNCRDIRCMGSAALNLCWVGCGRLDAFFERDLKVYDYAAGLLIAGEAGAAVEAASSNEVNLTIASAPNLFSWLRAETLSPT